MCSSSFLIFVSKSMVRRTFFSNSGDFRFALVFRTESDTGSPHAQAIFEKTFWQRQWREPSLTVYEFHHHCATAGLEWYSPMLRTVRNAVEAIANRPRRYTMPGMPA